MGGGLVGGSASGSDRPFEYICMILIMMKYDFVFASSRERAPQNASKAIRLDFISVLLHLLLHCHPFIVSLNPLTVTSVAARIAIQDYTPAQA